MLNCAFDSRFVESQVSPVGFEANLAGLKIVNLNNSGSEQGQLYADFVSPTNFTGKVVTSDDLSSFEAADWSLRFRSALQDNGIAIEGISNDISGVFRPQGAASDIGAYEKPLVYVTDLKDASGLSLSETSDVVVAAGGTLRINQTGNLSNLVIEGGGRVTSENSNTLNVNNRLIINSDDNGTGTYVEKGNSVLTSGAAIVHQYLTSSGTGASGRNWYISSPVANASTTSITGATGNGLVMYSESQSEWVNAGSTLAPGKGYIALSPASNSNIAFEGGMLNTGTQTITNLSYQGLTTAQKGFHLIGNPYPSFLDWSEAARENVSATIWFRSKSTGSYLFQTYNAISGLGTMGGTSMIPPMQGFWVRVTAAENQIRFENSMRSHQNQDLASGRLKAPANNQQQVLRLEISNELNSDETIIYFNPNASDEIDAYDSQKLSNNNVNIPEIYSVVSSQKLVMNGMESLRPNQIVNLGYFAGKSGFMTIKATEISNFNSATKISLVDHLLNQEIDLTNGDEYHFDSEATDNNTRFSVLFTAPSVTTDQMTINNDGLHLIVQPNRLLVIAESESIHLDQGEVMIYSMLGELIMRATIQERTTILNHNLLKGVYVVSLRLGGASVSRKILID